MSARGTRRWWRTPTESAGPEQLPDPPDPPDPPDTPETTATARLHELAGAGATGACEFSGAVTGTVYLVGGNLGYLHSGGVPGLDLRLRMRGDAADQLPPLTLQAVTTDVLADAALDLLGSPEPPCVETRFTAGQEYWKLQVSPRPLGQVLAEVTRRQRVLAALAGLGGPDVPLRRATTAPAPQVRLTPVQWDVVRLADGSATPRALAWMLGRGVFGTTVEVATLVRAGVLAPPEGTDPRSWPVPFATAAAG